MVKSSEGKLLFGNVHSHRPSFWKTLLRKPSEIKKIKNEGHSLTRTKFQCLALAD